MSLKVLVVDDDTMIVLLHKEIVKRFVSPEVLSFNNGEKALSYLEEHSQEISPVLILLDINMPYMNGWELLDAMQALPATDHIFVVMVTSSINSKDREKASQYAQVIGYVEKPLSIKPGELFKQIPQLAALCQ